MNRFMGVNRRGIAQRIGLGLALAALLIGMAGAVAAQEPPPIPDPIPMPAMKGYFKDVFVGDVGTEIVRYDAATGKAYATTGNGVAVLDLSVLAGATERVEADPVLEFRPRDDIALADGTTSVEIFGDYLAVTCTGWSDGMLAFYEKETGTYLNHVMMGNLPDEVRITPDGTKLLIANEGERYGEYDPVGSISVVDISGIGTDGMTPADLTQDHVTTIPMMAWDGQNAQIQEWVEEGLYLYNATSMSPASKSLASELEPEHLSISPDGTKAYVTLQENNAVAVFDIETGTWEDLHPLGYKDHSIEGYGLDTAKPSKDGGTVIRTWDNLYSLAMPDGIEAFEHQGRDYIIVANEGSNDWDGTQHIGYLENLITEERGRAAYDETAFPYLGYLYEYTDDQGVEHDSDDYLGQYEVFEQLGDFDGDGDYDAFFGRGQRSFTIWEVTAEGLQFASDTGDWIDRVLGDRIGDEMKEMGGQPEHVTVGKVDDRLLGFVGVERGYGVMMFDITDPYDISFLDYFTTPGKEFRRPEGMLFLDSLTSPTGIPMLLVANERGDFYALEVEIPEPTTMALLGCGAVGLIGARLRRRRTGKALRGLLPLLLVGVLAASIGGGAAMAEDEAAVAVEIIPGSWDDINVPRGNDAFKPVALLGEDGTGVIGIVNTYGAGHFVATWESGDETYTRIDDAFTRHSSPGVYRLIGSTDQAIVSHPRLYDPETHERIREDDYLGVKIWDHPTRTTTKVVNTSSDYFWATSAGNLIAINSQGVFDPMAAETVYTPFEQPEPSLNSAAKLAELTLSMTGSALAPDTTEVKPGNGGFYFEDTAGTGWFYKKLNETSRVTDPGSGTTYETMAYSVARWNATTGAFGGVELSRAWNETPLYYERDDRHYLMQKDFRFSGDGAENHLGTSMDGSLLCGWDWVEGSNAKERFLYQKVDGEWVQAWVQPKMGSDVPPAVQVFSHDSKIAMGHSYGDKWEGAFYPYIWDEVNGLRMLDDVLKDLGADLGATGEILDVFDLSADNTALLCAALIDYGDYAQKEGVLFRFSSPNWYLGEGGIVSSASVPEPATTALLALGGLGLLARRRRAG